PLLMWVLDLWPESLAAIGSIRSPTLLELVGGIVRFIYRRCERLLVQSQAFIEHARRYGASDAQIRYFPGWPEGIFDHQDRRLPEPEELRSYRDSFKIVFAGNVGETQDFPAILDAAESLREVPDVRIIVVGDGRAAAMVRREIARRDLHERLIMLGRF